MADGSLVSSIQAAAAALGVDNSTFANIEATSLSVSFAPTASPTKSPTTSGGGDPSPTPRPTMAPTVNASYINVTAAIKDYISGSERAARVSGFAVLLVCLAAGYVLDF